jgi:hypothetical protein
VDAAPLVEGELKSINLELSGAATGDGGCAERVPPDATAVAVSIVAMGAVGNGTLWSHMDPLSQSVPLLYFASDGPTAVSAIVPLRDHAIMIGAQGGPAHVVIDVTGYFVQPSPTSAAPATTASGALCTPTVCEILTGTGLTGGPITTTGTISLIVPVALGHGGTNTTTTPPAGRVIYSDGTRYTSATDLNWLASSARLQTNIQDKAGQVFNVKAWGAAGDGSADDQPEIQAAIDNLPSGGGIVFFPPGTYRINNPITIGNGTASLMSAKNGVWLMGSGGGNAADHTRGYTTLVWGGTGTGPMIQVVGPIVGVRITDMVLNCDGPGTDANTGLHMLHPQESTFSHIKVLYARGWAYVLEARPTHGVTGNGANNNVFDHVFSYSNLTYGGVVGDQGGIKIGQSTAVGATLDPAQNTFIGCRFRFDGSTGPVVGIQLQLTDHLTFLQCLAFTNAHPDSVGLRSVVPTGGSIFPGTIWFYNSPIGNAKQVGNWTGTGNTVFWPYPVGDGQVVPTDPMFSGITAEGHYFGTSFFKKNPLWASTIASSVAVTTTTPTLFSTQYTLPAGALAAQGTVLRVRASGRYTTPAGNYLILRIMVGGQIGVDAFLNTTAGASNWGWSAEGQLTVRTPGASATIQRGFGVFGTGGQATTAPATAGSFNINTGSAQTIAVEATWTAGSGNSIVMDSLTVEVLYPGSTS